jgi:hypothetical protein
MKKHFVDFLRRGFAACGFGPLVLAILYLILHQQGQVETLTVNEVCVGIFSLSALAFVAGGMNIIYQMERLPMVSAALIHAGVLYLDYLLMYLLNSWIPRNAAAIGIFTGIFAAGYALVWLFVNLSIRSKADHINKKLQSDFS